MFADPSSIFADVCPLAPSQVEITCCRNLLTAPFRNRAAVHMSFPVLHDYFCLLDLLKWNMRAASVAFIVWTWDPHISGPPWSFKEAERGNLKLGRQSNQINLFGQDRDQAMSKWMLSKKFPDRYKWGEFHCSIAHCKTLNRQHSIMYNCTTSLRRLHIVTWCSVRSRFRTKTKFLAPQNQIIAWFTYHHFD